MLAWEIVNFQKARVNNQLERSSFSPLSHGGKSPGVTTERKKEFWHQRIVVCNRLLIVTFTQWERRTLWSAPGWPETKQTPSVKISRLLVFHQRNKSKVILEFEELSENFGEERNLLKDHVPLRRKDRILDGSMEEYSVEQLKPEVKDLHSKTQQQLKLQQGWVGLWGPQQPRQYLK